MPMIIRWLGLCCLMSFSTIIKLYGGGQINEIFVTLFGLFKRKQICAGFFYCLFIYVHCIFVYVLPLDIQLSGGEDCDPINQFNPATF
jgi:hypothetical protein